MHAIGVASALLDFKAKVGEAQTCKVVILTLEGVRGYFCLI